MPNFLHFTDAQLQTMRDVIHTFDEKPLISFDHHDTKLLIFGYITVEELRQLVDLLTTAQQAVQGGTATGALSSEGKST